jgi:hypothetical protein
VNLSQGFRWEYGVKKYCQIFVQVSYLLVEISDSLLHILPQNVNCNVAVVRTGTSADGECGATVPGPEHRDGLRRRGLWSATPVSPHLAGGQAHISHVQFDDEYHATMGAKVT